MIVYILLQATKPIEVDIIIAESAVITVETTKTTDRPVIAAETTKNTDSVVIIAETTKTTDSDIITATQKTRKRNEGLHDNLIPFMNHATQGKEARSELWPVIGGHYTLYCFLYRSFKPLQLCPQKPNSFQQVF